MVSSQQSHKRKKKNQNKQVLVILLDLLTCQNYFYNITPLLRVSVLHQQVVEHVLGRDFPFHATITDN